VPGNPQINQSHAGYGSDVGFVLWTVEYGGMRQGQRQESATATATAAAAVSNELKA